MPGGYMQKFSILFMALLLIPSFSFADEKHPPAKINPHTDKGNCEQCHVASEEELNSWFTFPSTKKALRKDFNAVCQQCHGVQFGHGVGKWTKINLEGLPMDSQGNIACAITCHDMHAKSDDFKQSRFHLRLPQQALCLSCHNK